MFDTLSPEAAIPPPEVSAPALSGRHILYITHRLPYPPAGGARVRAFHSIRHLAACNRVTVAAPVRSAAEADAAQALAVLGHRVVSAPIGRYRALAQAMWHAGTARPASVGYFAAPGLGRRLRAALAADPPDLIVVHCSAVAHYAAAWPGVPKVLDFVDMDSRKWRDYSRVTPWPFKLVHAWEGWTLGRAERRWARGFDLSLTATEAEAESLTALAGPVPNAVVRNGVDLDYFHPTPDPQPDPPSDPHEPDHLCFVGRMDYFPNIQAVTDFCREVLPRLHAVRPGMRLSIVGADPAPAVRALAADPAVTVTGSVADVRPYVRRAALTVAPLKLARGTQNKILESMALGVPVVASDLAARGVDAEPGRHLLAATGAEATAAAILRVLDDPALRARLAHAGRDLVASRYRWTTTLAALETALADCLSPAASRREDAA